ncbi:MAG: AAA family ATPase [Pseudomonadota bacterium]|nr:AAA family ATPase [Pseudomonadota bacterium]
MLPKPTQEQLDNFVMPKFVMPPPVDPARWESIRNRVIDAVQTNGHTLARLAVEIGYDADRLEAWLIRPQDFSPWGVRVGEKSTPEKIADALEKRLEQLDQANAQWREPGRVETSVTRAIMEGIATFRDMCVMGLIEAASGLGKSAAIREYIARAMKAEGYDCPVWFITLGEFNLTGKALLLEMAEQCGATNYKAGNDHELKRAIHDATRDRNGVFIVDEAQQLAEAKRLSGINLLNGLREFADGGYFGLALLDNGEVYRRLSAGKHTQIRRRVETWRVEIAELGRGKKGQPALTNEDVCLIMAAWGVHGEKEVAYCLKVASLPGALGTMTDIFRAARRRFGHIDAATMNAIRRLT